MPKFVAAQWSQENVSLRLPLSVGMPLLVVPPLTPELRLPRDALDAIFMSTRANPLPTAPLQPCISFPNLCFPFPCFTAFLAGRRSPRRGLRECRRHGQLERDCSPRGARVRRGGLRRALAQDRAASFGRQGTVDSRGETKTSPAAGSDAMDRCSRGLTHDVVNTHASARARSNISLPDRTAHSRRPCLGHFPPHAVRRRTLR